MKKAPIFLLLVLLTSVIVPQLNYAQGVTTLEVLDMPGFPDLPNDTAYEGQTYAFDVVVVNNTIIPVNGTLEIVLKTDSVETVIYANPAPGLQPGATITLNVTGYTFDQAKYNAGNNIVVVWPRVTNQVIPTDTFYTNVFFVPLNSLGDGLPDVNSMYFNAFPVPAVDFINFDGFENKTFEYVRIFAVTGKLVMEYNNPSLQKFYIGHLPSGTYFVETGMNNRGYHSKFVRQ